MDLPGNLCFKHITTNIAQLSPYYPHNNYIITINAETNELLLCSSCVCARSDGQDGGYVLVPLLHAQMYTVTKLT